MVSVYQPYQLFATVRSRTDALVGADTATAGLGTGAS
jgi:hypothetical protein